jgi:hypothetical protein
MALPTSEVPDNPLLAVHTAFWALLEARTVLTKLIRPANRIRLDGTTFKSEVGNADLPELRVVPTASVPHLEATSNSTFLTERWQVQVATGEWDVKRLFDIKFEVMRALLNWQAHLRAVTWKGNPIVHDCRAPTVDDGLFEADLARGVAGWTTIWTCEIELHFANTDLLSED